LGRGKAVSHMTNVQKVVVVNGNTEVLGMLETVLEAGHYDMVFVESSDHAYSQIKKVVPDLVILCTNIEELDGLQLLTMLKMDGETRSIPVVTCATEHQSRDFDDVIAQLAEEEEDAFPSRPAPRMH
jgi:CheY-like chemotaxis protein